MKMNVYINILPLLLRGKESVAIFVCLLYARVHNRSAEFTQEECAETVICSAVVTNSSSRLDSFTTFSSQQSPTRLIVDLSNAWELYFWPDSRVCASSRSVQRCERARCARMRGSVS